MKRPFSLQGLTLAGLLTTAAQAQEAAITVQADQVLHRVSPYLTGACLEDVNHEVYGGIDSQMIFGESFAEPAPQPALKGFSAYGGRWTPAPDGSLQAAGADGPKLVLDELVAGDGEASVDLWFSGQGGGNAGLILKVTQAAKGADQFNGYEVSLEPSGTLVLGRHRRNWEPIRRVPCEVPLNQWLTLRARMEGQSLEVFVNGKSITRYTDAEHPLPSGSVGVRNWQLDARFRNLSFTARDGRRDLPFVWVESATWRTDVSGMWRAVRRGTAEGRFSLEERGAFVGSHSQEISFTQGTGEIGIENQGLNRWGMCFIKGKSYQGYVWARTASPTEILVALESRDGVSVYAGKRLKLGTGDWQRLDFTLKPDAMDKAGRFALKLQQPGAVTVGYAFLQPGPWGRFKGLPVRKDVAEGLINQGITVLRYGGCMANAAEYRWKKMIGPRAHRPPYAGWWYPHSSNGWGIPEFLSFCEAAGFAAVPDVNLDETPRDMADFVQYANGPADSQWGRKRAEDGHPKPYHLKYLEIGNEEKVNEDYWRRFEPIAEAVWAKDPNIILVVGDFAYGQPIEDPSHFAGAAGGISSLAVQRKILDLAKRHDREVWFDIHIGTEGPRPDFGGALTYIDALDKLANGAKHRVVIFEFNAGNHSQRRALANARPSTVSNVMADSPRHLGQLPCNRTARTTTVGTKGLLFLNPSQVWLQPPGYVTR